MCKGGGARDQKAKYVTSNFAEEFQVKGIRLHTPPAREPCGRAAHGARPSILAVPRQPRALGAGGLFCREKPICEAWECTPRAHAPHFRVCVFFGTAGRLGCQRWL